jgi:GntR family transcriptional regulator/MocR family aminotransferase
MLTISLDKDSQQPLYQQVTGQIIRQIESGVLAPHTRLPSTRDLAERLGVARVSVISAYDELKEAGYVVSQVGRGTFVTGALPAQARQQAQPTQVEPPLRRLMRLAEQPHVINFANGAPPDSFLPVGMIRSALDDVLARDGAAAIAYEAPEGNAELRQAIADMVARDGIRITPENVLITGGCQQALDLVIQALLQPGDRVLTSNPTYPGFMDIAQARGIQLVGIPVDRYGMQTDRLDVAIAEHNPRLLYVAPTYHNPTGSVMPAYRREELLAAAARHNIPVLEDGVYQELTYLGAPPPPLKALDQHDLVLHASSFSKVMLPGMRIGYLLVSDRLYRRIARVKQAADVCTPALNQRAVQAALNSGQFNTHLERARAACLARRSAVLGAVTTYLPEATWHEPGGGLYLWLQLPHNGPTATELFIQAVDEGVAFAPGPLFHLGGSGAHCMRLNMAAYPPEKAVEGIMRLARVWRTLSEGSSNTSVPFL